MLEIEKFILSHTRSKTQWKRFECALDFITEVLVIFDMDVQHVEDSVDLYGDLLEDKPCAPEQIPCQEKVWQCR